MSSIGQFKEKLARIRVGSFRYQMTKGIWKSKRINNTRACTFYWWYLPSSAFAWFCIGIVFVCWTIATYTVVFVGWLLGFTPERTVAPNNDPMDWKWHGGYGYNPVTKRRSIIAPQHWVLIAAAVTLIVAFTLMGGIPWAAILTISTLILATILTFATIGYIVTRRAVKDAWHRICPELTVTDKGA